MGEAEPCSYKTNCKVAQFCLQVPHLGVGRQPHYGQEPQEGEAVTLQSEDPV